MSAFILQQTHITALVRYAICGHNGTYLQSSGPIGWYHKHHNGEQRTLVYITSETAQRVGQILVNENYRSVNKRYNETDQPYTYEYRPNPMRVWKPVEIIKACNCYDYQACETEGYKDSEAHDIVHRIRQHAILLLPGYDAAKTWDISE